MKPFTYILLLGAFLLSACKRECRIVQSTYSNSKEEEVFIYPDCNDTTYYLRQFFDTSGQKLSEGYYKNGIKNGKFKEWNTKGIQIAEWEVADGKETGFIQCWYNNGVKKRECTLDKGVQHGHFKQWYENGKPEYDGYYENEKEVGTWKCWLENES